ncbi:MAG TPA: hypothetical protein VEA80_05040 [Vitreimonas sp.]|uniref:hypothetical protein n=1 Tax=Vitreimonas sp. TaxID=3069702 RepID=UPI002D471152|nr:hypothetical protein [Vitreimonas sp.]HYD86818.1 hypothetical protein [Vitreimonas sp.]
MGSDFTIRRTLVFGAAATLATASAGAQEYVTAVGMLDGTWEGDLGPVDGAGLSPARLRGVRLVISGQTVAVFVPDNGSAIEVKPGAFSIQRDGTNAVITSIEVDPGRPRNEGWVETWCFVITLRDADTLITNFVRVVNNNDMPPDEPSARFSQIAAGELRRVADDV